MTTVTVPTSDGSIDLHVHDTGSGRPVVLIHGWPLSGQAWQAQVEPLEAAGHRVISYDRRGFGWSAKPDSGYDYDTFAADLNGLLSTLDLTDVTLVGFSMGGGEIARYAGTFGTDRLRSVVFAAAVPPYLYQSDDNPDGGLDDATIATFEDGVRSDRSAFLKQFVEDFTSAGDRHDLVSDADKEHLVELAEEASPEATLACIAAFGRTDFRADLGAVALPTLVVHGDSDGIVPFEVSGKRTAETVPGAELHVVEGGPHGINASHPEEFNRVLLEFLAR